MLEIFGSKSWKLEAVNMAGRLEELGLDLFFGSSSWPDIAPVRELATKVRSLSGEGFANPFVYVDLKKYVCARACIHRFICVVPLCAGLSQAHAQSSIQCFWTNMAQWCRRRQRNHGAWILARGRWPGIDTLLV